MPARQPAPPVQHHVQEPAQQPLHQVDDVPPGHHLTLRPGTPVMAREPGVLQVGLHPPALRLTDTATIREQLRRLQDDAESALGEPPSPRLLQRLDAAGLLVVVPDDERSMPPATLRAQFGRDAGRRQRARAAARIAVQAREDDAAALAELLDRAGLARAPSDDLDAAVHLVIARGPLDRAVLDPLVQGSVPHLVVAGDAAQRRVGPFVDPGRTACQRCVDAHEALHDARLPLLLCQAARAAAQQPPPADPLLDQIAFAWAVRDLCRFVEGEEPSTWSSTISLGPTGWAEQVRWGRHPECGCAWDVIDIV